MCVPAKRRTRPPSTPCKPAPASLALLDKSAYPWIVERYPRSKSVHDIRFPAHTLRAQPRTFTPPTHPTRSSRTMQRDRQTLWSAAPLPATPPRHAPGGQNSPTLSFLEPDAVTNAPARQPAFPDAHAGLAALALADKRACGCSKLHRLAVIQQNPFGQAADQKPKCPHALTRGILRHGAPAVCYLALHLQLTHALMSQKQHEELDCAAAISALQWAATTVACTRSGYPKVCPRLNLFSAATLQCHPPNSPATSLCLLSSASCRRSRPRWLPLQQQASRQTSAEKKMAEPASAGPDPRCTRQGERCVALPEGAACAWVAMRDAESLVAVVHP